MHTWKSHLRSVLFRLARTHGHSPLADVERLLAEVFDGAGVQFSSLEDHPLEPELPLRDLLARPFQVALRIDYQPQRGGLPDVAGRAGDAPVVASRFRPEPPLSPEQRVDWFIREFDRLEQTHEFMWAGYIVKEMLPRIGVATAAAREMLDELRATGIVTVRKVPNPKNPEHPASSVELNRDHDHVRAVLSGAAPPSGDSQDPSNQPAEPTDA
jgi:hypothetical protein